MFLTVELWMLCYCSKKYIKIVMHYLSFKREHVHASVFLGISGCYPHHSRIFVKFSSHIDSWRSQRTTDMFSEWLHLCESVLEFLRIALESHCEPDTDVCDSAGDTNMLWNTSNWCNMTLQGWCHEVVIEKAHWHHGHKRLPAMIW
jgi:hypothetical protein